MSQTVEGSDSSAQERSKFRRVSLGRNSDTCFTLQDSILAVASIAGDAVDELVLAHLVQSALARSTCS